MRLSRLQVRKGRLRICGRLFDASGNPTLAFGTDADLLNKQGLEAALDYDDYADRVGITENGKSIYHDTAEYRMIDPSGDSVDSSKS